MHITIYSIDTGVKNMQKLKLNRVFSKKAIKLRHHSRVYFVSKAKLNYALNKMGMYGKFNFHNISLKEFLFENRLLYTEFLEHISDFWKAF